MIRSLKRQPRTPFKGAGRDPKGVVPHQEKENIMKKFAVAAALLSAVVAVPAMAANGGEARAEVRGGYVTGSGLDDATLGAAVGYRSEEHTSELQSLMRISYAVFCL